MKTKCFKLVDGDEIIADVTNETGEFSGLKNPMALRVVGEGQLAMYPWLPLADKQEHILEHRHVLIEYTPNQQLVSGYKQRTGGIVTASANTLSQLENW